MKINEVPVSVGQGSVKNRLEKYLEIAPDNEVFTTEEVSATIGCTPKMVVLLTRRFAFNVFVSTVKCGKRYWGSKKAIKSLKARLGVKSE